MEISLDSILIPLCIAATAILGFVFKKIDLLGAFSGAVLAYIIWIGGGSESLLALFLFFVLGSLASSWKKGVKNQYKLAQENDGKRGISNVLANGGVAGILSIIALVFPDHQEMLKLMIIASFATACSDTFSSELGNIYGRKYFNVISWKSATRGVDGVVSAEGLFVGIVGSALIAAIPMLFHANWKILTIVTIAGFLGNIIDSILGATLQQKGALSNHDVNFWATASGAFTSLVAIIIF